MGLCRGKGFRGTSLEGWHKNLVFDRLGPRNCDPRPQRVKLRTVPGIRSLGIAGHPQLVVTMSAYKEKGQKGGRSETDNQDQDIPRRLVSR